MFCLFILLQSKQTYLTVEVNMLNGRSKHAYRS